MYVIYTDLDEKLRLVNADTPEAAIAKAKASLTPEELEVLSAEQIKSYQKIKQIWDQVREDLEKREFGKALLETCPYKKPAEISSEINLEEYNWEVIQVIDPNQEVTVIEE